MKLNTTIGILSLALCTSAQATVFNYSFTGINAVIPDADANGWQNTQTIQSDNPLGANFMAAKYTEIQDVNVTLNLSGGWNGDLYGYLVSSDGFAVLLNRAGKTSGDAFGHGNTGFTVTLDYSAANDIHLYQNFSPTYNGQGQLQNPAGLPAAWQPDARDMDPATVTSGSGRTAFLTSFNGDNPHTSWTLFFSDNSPGEQSTLVGWGLQITAVPEPITYALAIFGIVALAVTLIAPRLKPVQIRLRK